LRGLAIDTYQLTYNRTYSCETSYVSNPSVCIICTEVSTIHDERIYLFKQTIYLKGSLLRHS